MARHFAQIFWGLLLVLLDFSINGIDIFPDGLGYLIAAAGCYGLITLSPKFEIARALCLGLAGLWLVGFFVQKDYAPAYSLVMTIVNCAMIWSLLGGLGDFAASQQRPDLAERASNRRIAYVAIMMAAQLLGLAFHGSSDKEKGAIISLIAALTVTAMILHLIHRTKVELAAYAPVPQL